MPLSFKRLTANAISRASAPKLTAIPVLMAAGLAFFAIPLLCSVLLVLASETNLTSKNVRDFADTGTLSIFVSWLGFLLFVPTFVALNRGHLNGWLPTALAGVVLGPISAALYFSVFWFDTFWGLLGNLEFLALMSVFGVLNAYAFWVLLSLIQWIFAISGKRHPSKVAPKIAPFS